jgi:SAM-dependent methyltransferase
MSVRDTYDRWAPLYPPVPHNALMRAEQDAVTPLLQGRVARRALDAGAGTGRYTSILRDAGASFVVSLDWSFAMLRAHGPGAARVCGDSLRLPFGDGAFDLVNASLMAGDLPSLGPWLGEVARVLTAGGRLVYSDFHPAWHEHGWRRTFRDEAGTTLELPCAVHGLDEHRRTCAAAGLVVETLREVGVPRPSRLLDRWLGQTGTTERGLVIVSATRGKGTSP